MALVVINIDRKELPAHTNAQFEEWIKYKVGQSGSISLKNPLHEYDIKATVREIQG